MCGLDLGTDVNTAPSAFGMGERLDAVVPTFAGLQRIGFDAHATGVPHSAIMMPAPSQNAFVIETRDGDDPLLHALLGTLNRRSTALAASTERAVLSVLSAGCAAPVGVFTHADEAPSVPLLDTRAMSADGCERVKAKGSLALMDLVGLDEAARPGEDMACQLSTGGATEVTNLGATKAPRQSS